jgi:hypothetical protein
MMFRWKHSDGSATVELFSDWGNPLGIKQPTLQQAHEIVEHWMKARTDDSNEYTVIEDVETFFTHSLPGLSVND